MVTGVTRSFGYCCYEFLVLGNRTGVCWIRVEGPSASASPSVTT